MVIVKVIETEEDSRDLFGRWNVNQIDNVMCSNYNANCNNTNIQDAYIVETMGSQDNSHPNRFIIPLCTECYQGSIRMSHNQDIINYGITISVKEDVLVRIDD